MKLFLNIRTNKNFLKQIDFVIIISLALICIFSLANIYSATHIAYKSYFLKNQLLWIFISAIVTFLILNIDYRRIANYSTIIYWSSILLLLYTYIGGETINGARAWINLRIIHLEPGELVKLTLTILLAKKIEDMDGTLNKPKNILILMFYSLLPLLLIIKQPDLGIAGICFIIILSILFIGGIDLKMLFIGLSLLLIISTTVWNTNLIKPYQKTRLTAFLHQNEDTLGQGYQLAQSKIAIGSGGVYGRGYLNGTQVTMGVIPENHTDFIFAVIGEEWGLRGGVFLLLLYGIIIIRMIKIAKDSKDVLGSLICVGVSSGFIISVMINIGMTIGIMPITGVTLPFVSYGGSSLLTNFIAVGLVLKVGMRNKNRRLR